MFRFRELVREIHRRSIWQVLGIYVAGSWGVLQVIEMFVDLVGLPDWILPFAVVLLLIGLPVVIATAFVQEGMPHGDERAEPASAARAAAVSEGSPGGPGIADIAHLFTWRNALAGGIIAFALWGVVAAGWLMFADPSASPDGVGVPPSGALARALDTAPARSAPAVVDDSSGPSGPSAGEAREGDTGEGGTDPDEEADEERAPVGVAARDEPRRVARPAGVAEPPRREGAPDPGRVAYESARVRIRELRTEAEAVDSREAAAAAMARADSLWGVALAVAGQGRFADAAADLERAGALYEQAELEATTAWRRRLDSARAEVTALRDASEPVSGATPEGVDTLLAAAARDEAAGAYRAALSALGRAADAYRRAGRRDGREPAGDAVREPAGEPGPAEEPDPTVARPTARARVEGVLAALERAFEAEDGDALRAVWTSLTRDQLENFERFFEDRRDIDVTIEPQWETLMDGEDRITVSARINWDYYDESQRRRERPPAFEQRFEIAERDGRWVIVGS